VADILILGILNLGNFNVIGGNQMPRFSLLAESALLGDAVRTTRYALNKRVGDSHMLRTDGDRRVIMIMSGLHVLL
jgi:hypothetical protein